MKMPCRSNVKCRYKYCKHETKDVVKEEAIEHKKGFYYHPDCYREWKNKEKTVGLFLEKINRNSPIPQLRNVINTIVNKNGVDSGLLLFGLQFYIDNNIEINYPAGLYYVIANKNVQEEWNKKKYEGYKVHVDLSNTETGTTFVYKKPRRKTLDNFME